MIRQWHRQVNYTVAAALPKWLLAMLLILLVNCIFAKTTLTTFSHCNYADNTVRWYYLNSAGTAVIYHHPTSGGGTVDENIYTAPAGSTLTLRFSPAQQNNPAPPPATLTLPNVIEIDVALNAKPVAQYHQQTVGCEWRCVNLCSIEEPFMINLRQNKGFALVFSMIFLFLIVSFMAVYILAIANGLSQANRAANLKKAYYIADAGLADAYERITQDGVNVHVPTKHHMHLLISRHQAPTMAYIR